MVTHNYKLVSKPMPKFTKKTKNPIPRKRADLLTDGQTKEETDRPYIIRPFRWKIRK